MAYTKLVFDDRPFAISGVPGEFVPGGDIIAPFSIAEDLDLWGQLGILFAFVIAIRILHYLLLWVHVYPYVKYQLDGWLTLASFDRHSFSSVFSVLFCRCSGSPSLKVTTASTATTSIH